MLLCKFAVEIKSGMKTTNNSHNIFTTTQESCNIIADLLVSYGVKHAIISPGSRNAPIIIALSRCKEISKHIIVDERSAAFAAIGIAQETDAPVAIICTSGSAVLNYAPAIAEAYYQRLPIIVISADRPMEWIDQNDSQTIHQHGILNNIVKCNYNIPADFTKESNLWYANRTINEALQTAVCSPTGPVHINMQFDEPLYTRKENNRTTAKAITRITPASKLDKNIYNELAERINSHKRVLIYTAIQKPCSALSETLNNISKGNIVVLSEILSNNNQCDNAIHNIDRVFSEITTNEWNDFAPELLITIGGAPVSRILKTFLRQCKHIEHWRIGVDNNIIDTMQNITHRIDIEPADFFKDIEPMLIPSGEYHKQWEQLSIQAEVSHNNYITNAPWSDLVAMSHIMKSLPTKNLNLQISNGSAIRHADIMGVPNGFDGRCNCNRGVSGIDGSTSTALGASMAYDKGITLFITGDMSFSYDLGGLATQYNTKRLKIIVLCNGGGGIFRFINGPSDLPEFERYFEVHRDIPVEKYAYAFGFDYFKATDAESLKDSLSKLYANETPSILAVYTDNKVSAETLKGYFTRNKH